MLAPPYNLRQDRRRPPPRLHRPPLPSWRGLRLQPVVIRGHPWYVLGHSGLPYSPPSFTTPRLASCTGGGGRGGYPYVTSNNNPLYERKRRRGKHDTGRALCLGCSSITLSREGGERGLTPEEEGNDGEREESEAPSKATNASYQAPCDFFPVGLIAFGDFLFLRSSICDWF